MNSKPAHGGPRPGSGRRHLDGTPAGITPWRPSSRRTVHFTADQIAWLEAQEGNFSQAVRRCVDAAMEQIERI